MEKKKNWQCDHMNIELFQTNYDVIYLFLIYWSYTIIRITLSFIFCVEIYLRTKFVIITELGQMISYIVNYEYWIFNDLLYCVIGSLDIYFMTIECTHYVYWWVCAVWLCYMYASVILIISLALIWFFFPFLKWVVVFLLNYF